MNNVKFKILIVDDEPHNLELLGQILKDQYQLSFATNGATAIDVARKIKPDIILLDVMMPGMDGYEVCVQLKSNDEMIKIPVIFITALSEVEDEKRGFDAGGVDYITKPVSKPIVQARVQTHLSLYKQNQILETTVEQRTADLKKALDKLESYSLDSIFRLCRASEYKDEDTGAHIQRMSHYSAAIARQMGLNENVCKWILYAAPMHDIGKIGIPDRVLLKPGKLDDEEFGIIKQHAIYGGKILENAKAGYLKLGEVIALPHHEKWDGSGYPNGLKGKEIPKVGQIVAVADVFDALTSKRPYKKPFSVEQSFEIIQKGSGTHFSPEVVKAFFEITEEILAIKDNFTGVNGNLSQD
ncbi:MAG: two-component system response regulator [Desulfamplus sp.]|nr:two-component system response regulator [Desulfamplus sp.]